MTLQEIERAIGAKCDVLHAAESTALWRFYQGDLREAYRPDYDDQAWAEVRMPHTWLGAAGDAWLRHGFVFPASIEGISTTGASVELPFFTLIQSAVYVDGVERLAEPSWLDTRAVPLVICERYQPGQNVQVTMYARQGDGFALCMMDHVEISTVEDCLFRLGVALNQLRFTHYLAGKRGAVATWADAVAALNLPALAANAWDAWWQSVEAVRAGLLPLFADEAKTYTTHLIGHSHIDMNWLWTWDETVDVIRRDFNAADQLMQRYPAFRFSQSQASTYRAMEERHPDVLQRVQQRVAEGRWDVTASTWVEGDLNLECGESLVRQLLLARPYIQRLLRARPRICWEPDTFGHVATLPQLLQQAGIEYYYFCRAGKGQPLFWWEGLDGSRVLAFNDPLGYGGVVDAEGVAAPTLDLAQRYGLKRGLFVYGVGDHGGGATARDIEHALQLDATPLLPHAQLSDTLSFYDNAKAEGAQTLPVIRGEWNTTFEGCYTTHADIKRSNRDCENGLLTAESLATLAKICVGQPYPAQALSAAWHTLLFHQFHDILCGCAIGATYREAAARLQPALESVKALQQAAAQQLGAQVDTGQGAGARCVVWNPLAWARTDVVRVASNAFGAVPLALVDDSGAVLPVQVVGDELLFIADAVPALGCRVYGVADRAAETPGPEASDDATLRNGFLSFHVHAASGAIDALHDVEYGRTVDTLSTWHGVERKESAGMINRLQIAWEAPHPMSAWNIGDITRVDSLLQGAQVRVVERGPVRATVEVTHKVLHSIVRQRYALYAGLRRIDIETEIDWHELGGKGGDSPMLRAIFKPQLNSGVATFEVPFAGLERNATGDEAPALRWADVSDGSYGLSLLNDGKYGHSAHGTTLGLTLVRAPYEPDNAPDQGVQRFSYALYPHVGDWRQAATDRRGAEYNQPLQATLTTTHAGALKPGQPLLACEPANVMVTAVKLSEAHDGAIIVRLVEMQGHAAQAQLNWGWAVRSVEEVNILEEHLRELPFEGQGCAVALGAHKVVTLRLTVA